MAKYYINEYEWRLLRCVHGISVGSYVFEPEGGARGSESRLHVWDRIVRWAEFEADEEGNFSTALDAVVRLGFTVPLVSDAARFDYAHHTDLWWREYREITGRKKLNPGDAERIVELEKRLHVGGGRRAPWDLAFITVFGTWFFPSGRTVTLRAKKTGSPIDDIELHVDGELRETFRGLLSPGKPAIPFVIELTRPGIRLVRERLAREPERPLTENQRLVYELLLRSGPLVGSLICHELDLAQSTLTTHLIPELKKRGLIGNRRGAGYFAFPRSKAARQ